MNVTLLQSTYYGEGDSIADMEIDYSRHELILCGQSADSSLGTVNTDNNAPAGSADVVILGFDISGNFSGNSIFQIFSYFKHNPILDSSLDRTWEWTRVKECV